MEASSDFLLQSIGFISFLIPVTFFSISIHIFKEKKGYNFVK